MKKLSVLYLKLKLRRIIKEMDRIASEFDCGTNLLRVVSGRYIELEGEYRLVKEKLGKIDPNFPSR
jgi:hypothetical protein